MQTRGGRQGSTTYNRFVRAASDGAFSLVPICRKHTQDLRAMPFCRNGSQAICSRLDRAQSLHFTFSLVFTRTVAFLRSTQAHQIYVCLLFSPFGLGKNCSVSHSPFFCPRNISLGRRLLRKGFVEMGFGRSGSAVPLGGSASMLAFDTNVAEVLEALRSARQPSASREVSFGR